MYSGYWANHVNKSRFQVKGVTLIELMIVVVVVGILMAIVMPAYLGNVQKARRAEGKAALTGLTIAMERYYMEQSPSTYIGATLGSDPNDIFPDQVPIDAANKTYQLNIVSPSATGYSVTATPINAQTNDDCGTLSLTSLGVKGATGKAWSLCWN